MRRSHRAPEARAARAAAAQAAACSLHALKGHNFTRPAPAVAGFKFILIILQSQEILGKCRTSFYSSQACCSFDMYDLYDLCLCIQ
jgi:hypothetical protein